jgi:hypothetical protein
MKLDKSPFVIISVIGQELLAQAKYNAAVQVRISQEVIRQLCCFLTACTFKVAHFIFNCTLLLLSNVAAFDFKALSQCSLPVNQKNLNNKVFLLGCLLNVICKPKGA